MRKPFLWKERKAWYLRVPAEGGKLKTIRLGATKKAAYEEWGRMKAAAQRAVDSSADEKPLTIIALASEYLSHLKSEERLGRIASTTVTRQVSHLAPFLAVSSDLEVAEMKPHHVTTWLRGQSRWNATTQSDAAAVIKRMLQWATDEGRIEKNPVGRLKVAKGNPRDHVVSREEYEKLLVDVWTGNYARRGVTSFRQILIALRQSGCRPSEIVNLKVEDFDGETWTIKEHKTRKKKPRPRMVYLSPCLQTLSRIAARGRESGPLFLADAGRGWQYSDIRLRFQRLRAKTGTPKKCVLYSFRHTWITDALIAGVDVATVAEMAGTSIEMIDRHYGHLCQHRKHLTDAALKIATARVSRSA